MSESPLFSLCSLLCLCSVDVQVDTETSEVMFTIRSAHFISEKRGELCVSVRVCGHYINVQKRSRSNTEESASLVVLFQTVGGLVHKLMDFRSKQMI